MKKLLFILTLLFLFTLNIGAASTEDSTSFNIATDIAGLTQVIISDGAYNPTDKASFEYISPMGADSDNPVIFINDGFNTSHPLAVYAMTNVPGSYTIKTTAKPLKNAGGHVIPYSVKVGNGSPVVVSANTNITFSTFNQSSGLYFVKQTFDLSVTSDALSSAEAGSYTSAWTVELIKN